MRCFIAVAVPEPLKDKILEVQGKIKQSGSDLKLVEKENLHFTIKFLGEITEKEIDDVKEFLSSLKESAFEISIKGLGVFPTKDYIRVIWLGVDKNKEFFLNLIKKINKDLNKIRKDKKETEAHLTIARVKTARNKEKLRALITNLKDTEIGKMKIESLHLMASELTPEGPIYKELAKFKLE